MSMKRNEQHAFGDVTTLTKTGLELIGSGGQESLPEALCQTQEKGRREGDAKSRKGREKKIILLVLSISSQHSMGHYLSGDLIPEG